MTLEDPFFVVKDEVVKAVIRTRGIYQRWCELEDDSSVAVSREEVDWTSTELRNSLRSIEWDLEDLEETITIVEKNPRKFKIDEGELKTRKNFIDQTRNDIKTMKDRMSVAKAKEKDRKSRQPLLSSSMSGSQGYYTRLQSESTSPNREFVDGTMQQQQVMIQAQDGQLQMMQNSVGSLRNMSRHIGSELDEQAIMLDSVSHEMAHTESKLDSTMKKMANVFHMSNDRRQWAAIGVLASVMVIVVLLIWIL